MRRKQLLFGLFFICALLWPASSAAAAAPISTASAALLLEANTGSVLSTQNGQAMLPPASTTKIATALLVLDMMDDLDQPVLISPAAAGVPESSIHLRAGETLTVADLLTGALVHSGNDACFALAEATAGCEPLFVHWMNMKAALLGVMDANFCNTNGLPEDGHVISAEGLARLTAYAMEQPFFAETVAKKQASFGEGASYRSYQNTNKLLWHNEHVVGVKTGTTNEAGKCLVAAYRDGEALYISVMLHSADRYGESIRLLDWAADEYDLYVPFTAGKQVAWTEASGPLYAAADAQILAAPGTKVQVRWELPKQVCFFAAGKEIACVALYAGNSAPDGE